MDCTCRVLLTRKDAKLRKVEYGSQCGRDAVRFFRCKDRPMTEAYEFGRCPDHVSRDILRSLKNGDIEEITPEVRRPQSQASLDDQLDELSRLAAKHGLYDAQDWLKTVRDNAKATSQEFWARVGRPNY